MATEQLVPTQRYAIEVLPTGIVQQVPQTRVEAVRTETERHNSARVEGGVYAWGKTAREICEADYQEAIRNTSGAFVAVDLCSAFPIWPQIMRERRKWELYEEARSITGKAVQVIQANPEGSHSLPIFKGLDSDQRRLLRDTISPNHSLLRELLRAAVVSVLHEPPDLSKIITDEEKADKVTKVLADILRSSTLILQRVTERVDLPKGEKGRWDTIVPFEGGISFLAYIQLLIGEETGRNMTQALASYLATECMPKIRPYHVFSLDFSDPESLITEARRSFPDGFRDTDFYERAEHLGNKHICADALALPLAPGSVGFISCIEGYPFYFSGLPIDEEVEVTKPDREGNKGFFHKGHYPFAVTIADSLAEGGRAVFFPWHINDATQEDTQALEEVETYWKKRGLRVVKHSHDVEALKSKMNDREYVLIDHSPVFKNRSSLVSLTLEKLRVAYTDM